MAAGRHLPPSRSYTGMLAALPLMSHRAISTPLMALFSTGSLRQDELTRIICHRSSLLAALRPGSSGSRYSSTAEATTVARCVNVAQPSPYSPATSVSTLTTTSAMPSGAVRMDFTRVMRIARYPSRSCWLWRPYGPIRPAGLGPLNRRQGFGRIRRRLGLVDVHAPARPVVGPLIAAAQLRQPAKHLVHALAKHHHFLHPKVVAGQVQVQVGGVPDRRHIPRPLPRRAHAKRLAQRRQLAR